MIFSLSAALRLRYAARFSKSLIEDKSLNGAVKMFDLYLKKRSIVC